MALPGSHGVDRRATTKTLDGKPPECPRCGYDLSVATQTWPENACSVRGLCNECGLDFEWGAVLNPARRVPWWFFETPRGTLGTLRAALGTALASLAPPLAMRSVSMSLPHRSRRAIMLPVVLLVAWYALGIVAAHAENIFPPQPPSAHVPWWAAQPPPPTPVESLLWPVSANELAGGKQRWIESPIATLFPVLIAAHLGAMLLSFALLPSTLRKYKVRGLHFVRLGSIAATGVLGVAVTLLALRFVADSILYLQPQLPYGVETRLEGVVEWRRDGWCGFVWASYFAWSLAFWWSACRWYLRLPSPFFHAAMLFVVGTLLSVGVLFGTWRPVRSLVVDLWMPLL